MRIHTKHFGDISVKEEDIIVFTEGIPGFHNLKKYLYIKNEDDENPFDWIQSLEDKNLAFVVTNPFLFKQDYEFNIEDKIIEELKIKDISNVKVISIAVVPEDIKNLTINLKAPIIVNLENKIAKQVVLDKDYPIKYKIFEV